jgi:hypothetical protein
MNPLLVDGFRLGREMFENCGLRLAQRLHLGDLVPERRLFMLHPLDLELGQL